MDVIAFFTLATTANNKCLSGLLKLTKHFFLIYLNRSVLLHIGKLEDLKEENKKRMNCRLNFSKNRHTHMRDKILEEFYLDYISYFLKLVIDKNLSFS